MDKIEYELRQNLCEAGRRLYLAGFVPGSDGNISTILNENEVLITPSRLCKGYMEPHHIVKIDRQGRKLEGDLPPSSEVVMHLAAYEERPDICSVVHCHPPILLAYLVAGKTLPANVLQEFELMCGGEMPVATYALPGTAALADSIRGPIRTPGVDFILLDHHGALAVGQDVFQAVVRVEMAEASARVIYYARQLGGEKSLPQEALDGLRAARKRLVEIESQVFTGYCHGPECQLPKKPSQKEPAAPDGAIEALVRRVIAEMDAGQSRSSGRG
jgi:L-fuculose-phosphate aldolase